MTSEINDKLAQFLREGHLLDLDTLVIHRISYPLIRNSVYKFNSSYVHEFPTDKSLCLLMTEKRL